MSQWPINFIVWNRQKRIWFWAKEWTSPLHVKSFLSEVSFIVIYKIQSRCQVLRAGLRVGGHKPSHQQNHEPHHPIPLALATPHVHSCWTKTCFRTFCRCSCWRQPSFGSIAGQQLRQEHKSGGEETKVFALLAWSWSHASALKPTSWRTTLRRPEL